jgi:cell filamentation protein
MSDTAYCYPPDHVVLKNKLNIRDPERLDYFEREFTTQRSRQGLPTGIFDLKHLRAIHRHIFQDVYDRAGEIRTVEIAKGGHQFQYRRFIEIGMADVHKRLVAGTYLKHLPPKQFAERAGEILGDVKYVHPFREGNGRTQALYLEQLARQAGHPLNLRSIDKQAWMAASKAAHGGNYAPMGDCIYAAIAAS